MEPALLEHFVVDAHPCWQQIEEQTEEFDSLSDESVIIEQDPIPHYFALNFANFHLCLLPHGVSFWKFAQHIPELFLHVFLHLVEPLKTFHGSTDSHVQKLQPKEEKLSNSSKLSPLPGLLNLSRTDRIDTKVCCLFVVHEISRVNAPPLVVLSVSNRSAKTEEGDVSVNEDAIVRKIRILGVIVSMAKLHFA